MEWGYREELLALLLEEVSVLSSQHQRRAPLQIPRPGEAGETVARRDPPGTVSIDALAVIAARKGRMTVMAHDAA